MSADRATQDVMDRAIETIVRVFGAESVTDITTEAITNEVVAR